MGADQGAEVALDAGGRLPPGNLNRIPALIVLGSAAGPGAVHCAELLEDGHRQAVSLHPVHGLEDLLQEVSLRRGGGLFHRRIEPAGGDFHLMQGLYALVHGGAVQIHHLLTGLHQVGFLDSLLHGVHGLLHGNDAGQLEERGLEHGVGPVAQSQLHGDVGRVDQIQLGLLLRKAPLEVAGQLLV